MSAGVPVPPERKVIMAECHVGGVFGGLRVSFAVVGVLSGFLACHHKPSTRRTYKQGCRPRGIRCRNWLPGRGERVGLICPGVGMRRLGGITRIGTRKIRAANKK